MPTVIKSVISSFYTTGEAMGHLKVTKWQPNILTSQKYSWKHNQMKAVLYSMDTLCKAIFFVFLHQNGHKTHPKHGFPCQL